ncbi:MAG: tyrosine--tRNA ligase [Rhizobiales bacterium]|nr:tyrosine--tRNA ligase [Hyphomicrobiales bacterium]MDQ3561017.1 tyrosine--tRNA ligase [Pseudomonadota bacterium]
MTQFRSEFLRVMSERGYIHQCSDPEGLDARFREGPVTAYVGYDCTGPSLHVGHLLSIMMLRWMQNTGNRPITLMGGGTTRVGDPSGKDESRRILTLEQIEANKDSLKSVFARFLAFDGATGALMIDNAEWLAPLNYIDFLREVGRHFSVNRMLAFDSVKMRLERDQELSFLEFNYMILQAYDFVELHQRHGCVLQMGGSDQWGNIVNGIDLGRRMGAGQLYAVTCPLITTSSGAKMGKTAQGAIWLNPDQLSPYAYWQFWRNTEDADVGRFLRLFTELPLDEIQRLEQLKGAEVNVAKKDLATAATALLHGQEAADEAAETARQTFEEGGAGAALPRVHVLTAELAGGSSLAALAVTVGLAQSKSEARRWIAEGRLSVNDVRVYDPQHSVRLEDVRAGEIKLSMGKKRHALIIPN